MITYEKFKAAVDLKLTIPQIAEQFKVTPDVVWGFLKKFDLKTARKVQHGSDNKICRICSIQKDLKEFPVAGTIKGVKYHRNKCKSCYNDDKTFYRKNQVDFMQDCKKQGKCNRCGCDDFRVLEYHHRDPATKLFNLAESAGYGKDAIAKEIAKCDVLCANCHRIVEYEKKMLNRSVG